MLGGRGERGEGDAGREDVREGGRKRVKNEGGREWGVRERD